MTGKTEQQLHEEFGSGFPFGDPVDIVAEADRQELLKPVSWDDTSGPYVCKFNDGWATATDLRAIAQELDNRNGISG